MKEIEKVTIVGMGALGLLFGNMIRRELGGDAVQFVMDPERFEKHKDDVYTVNGEKVNFAISKPADGDPQDLVIAAVKAGGLSEAIDEIAGFVGPETTIISILNGISSEQDLIKAYGADRVLGCIARGMDAVRIGTSLEYSHTGQLLIGTFDDSQAERLEALRRFLDRAKIPYEVVADIRHALWNKCMLNVGINQTCMVYATDYGGALEQGSEARESMIQAMRETIEVARCEGVELTEKDLEANIAILETLDPRGLPSMRQDNLAHRRSEVDLFAGTVVRLAEKHSIDVPVNRRYLARILEIESGY